jgi:hypothetical protein
VLYTFYELLPSFFRGITLFFVAAKIILGMLKNFATYTSNHRKAAPNVMTVKPIGPNTVFATSARGFLS